MPTSRPLDRQETDALLEIEGRYTEDNSFTFEEQALVSWLIQKRYIVPRFEPNSPLELDAVMYALSKGEQAAFVPRLRATFAARDAEIARLRAMADALLPVARLYVDAFDPDETMTLPERLRLQQVEDILSDPDGWSPEQPIGGVRAV